jgi:putative membrane protein
VALLTGLHMTFTWPLPGPFNMAFGEMSVLFGAAYLAAAVAVGLGWSLVGVAVYGAIGGLGAVVVGIRILHLHLISHIHLTAMPALTAAGYILVGISALLVLGALASKAAKGLRILAAVLLFLSAGLWGFNAYGAYWMHFEAQKDWKPATMHAAAAQPASALAAEAAK